jgi:hypothetical protein
VLPLYTPLGEQGGGVGEGIIACVGAWGGEDEDEDDRGVLLLLLPLLSLPKNKPYRPDGPATVMRLSIHRFHPGRGR